MDGAVGEYIILDRYQEYWDTHGPARDVLGHAKSLMLSETSTVEERYYIGNASEKLRDIMWRNSEEHESIRNHTDMLADIVNELEDSKNHKRSVPLISAAKMIRL